MNNLQHIIKQSVKGDERAQRSLYLEYRAQWYMTAMRYGKNKFESDDIMQDGLIQIYRDLHQFDENRGSFNTWSSRIIAHAALRHIKKNRWQMAFQDLSDVEEQYDVQDEIAFDQLAAKELTMMIQELPIGYRLVFNMYALEGYKHKEIAEKLNISVGTSKSQLSKAKKLLRTRLETQILEFTRK